MPEGKISVEAPHFNWSGKIDGNDYPTSRDPQTDTASFTFVGENSIRITLKKGDQSVQTISLVFKGKKCTGSFGGMSVAYSREKE